MSARPDKYPACPPGVNPFDWIIRTAQALRRQQAHEVDIVMSRRAAERRRAAEALRESEAASERPWGQVKAGPSTG